MRDTVAAVNWDDYANEAVRAFAAASSADELAEAQVRYLGRRAELPQALRGVRDRGDRPRAERGAASGSRPRSPRRRSGSSARRSRAGSRSRST